MTATRIKQILDCLPDSLIEDMAAAGGRRHYISEYVGFQPDIARFVLGYREVAIGWKLAALCAQRGMQFPINLLDSSDDAVYRAYLYHCHPVRYGSDAMAAAYGLTLPSMHSTAVILRGLLLSDGMTAERAADKMCLNPVAVDIYEKLFFNVIDRKYDRAYLQAIVYPYGGRLQEFCADYIQKSDLGDLLLRTGYQNGENDLLSLSGVMPGSKLPQEANAGQMLEKAIMSQGYLLAKNGFLNQADGRTGGAIIHAKNLMTAGKIGGEQTLPDDLGSDIGTVLFADLLAHKKVDAIAAAMETRKRMSADL